MTGPKVIGNSKDQTLAQRHCNCKRSYCLKLYCDCFSAGIYCTPTCNCLACSNNLSKEATRRDAVSVSIERNPNAFRPKVAAYGGTGSHWNSNSGGAVAIARHNQGCRCKKSSCLKKYCECFQGNVYCETSKCRCVDCKNLPGNAARALVADDPANAATVSQNEFELSPRGDSCDASTTAESDLGPSSSSSSSSSSTEGGNLGWLGGTGGTRATARMPVAPPEVLARVFALRRTQGIPNASDRSAGANETAAPLQDSRRSNGVEGHVDEAMVTGNSGSNSGSSSGVIYNGISESNNGGRSCSSSSGNPLYAQRAPAVAALLNPNAVHRLCFELVAAGAATPPPRIISGSAVAGDATSLDATMATGATAALEALSGSAQRNVEASAYKNVGSDGAIVPRADLGGITASSSTDTHSATLRSSSLCHGSSGLAMASKGRFACANADEFEYTTDGLSDDAQPAVEIPEEKELAARLLARQQESAVLRHLSEFLYGIAAKVNASSG